jgi:citronellol/citronellal dehydrogenase
VCLQCRTGASRGIGLEIGKLLAQHGANVAVAAKTTEPHPKLPGTIYTAAEEIDEVAAKHKQKGKGLAIKLDIRHAEQVEQAIEQTVDRFGNLDILINNASAINMSPTVDATPKSYDLMNNINARGTWLVSRYALPHLLNSHQASRNPHILTLSPPLNMKMFDHHQGGYPSEFKAVGAAYSVSKLGMSIATVGLAAETQGKIACNCLWPVTLIGTSAMQVVSPNAAQEQKRWRSPAFVAEAALRILQQDSKTHSGQFHLDEVFLRAQQSFDNSTINDYNLGGPEVALEDLADDLFISGQIRDLLKHLRDGKPYEEFQF